MTPSTPSASESSNQKLSQYHKYGQPHSRRPTSTLQRSSSVLGCLDAIEKDFDKAFYDLDVLIGDVDTDHSELTFEARSKMTAISGCFAQLMLKAQALIQKNVILEVGCLHLIIGLFI